MDIFPDFDGLEGIGDLREVIGALLTFVLIIAVLMLIVCAIVWALSTANGHHAAATKARRSTSSTSRPVTVRTSRSRWTPIPVESSGRTISASLLTDRPEPARWRFGHRRSRRASSCRPAAGAGRWANPG